MNDEIAQALLQYIGENLQTESGYLTPQPSTSVEIVGLIDKIAELRGISKDENGHDFNQIMHMLELEQEANQQ